MSDDVDDRLLDAIALTAFDVMGVLSQVAATHDLSLTQLRALAILRDRRLRMSELADYLGLDRSTVSGLVDRAETRGLLTRTADADDRRASRLELTDRGRSLARAGETDIRRAVAPLFADLSTRDRGHLVELLERRDGSGGRRRTSG